jgi:hypothetical protein
MQMERRERLRRLLAAQEAEQADAPAVGQIEVTKVTTAQVGHPVGGVTKGGCRAEWGVNRHVKLVPVHTGGRCRIKCTDMTCISAVPARAERSAILCLG